MKLSIIVPIYRDKKILSNFFKRISSQTTFNFELILVIDTKLDNTLKIVEKELNENPKLDSVTKIIYNSKRNGRPSAIIAGAKHSSGTHSIILSASNLFKSSLIKEINEIIKSNDADIIEFKAAFKSPIKESGSIRKSFLKPVEISSHPEIIAYTYPFDFNKIYKIDVLRSASSFSSSIVVNSRFSLENTYKTFFFAKTYSTVSKELVVSHSDFVDAFNPLKIHRQWKTAISQISKRFDWTYTLELEYAYFFTFMVIFYSLVAQTKNKTLIKKYVGTIKTEIKNSNFFEVNKYVLLLNKETQKIKSLRRDKFANAGK